jgi:ketosteroid isomerase-like protein
VSRENVELVREAYEAYVAGDAERSLALFHEDVHVDFSVRVDATVTRGRQRLAEITSSWVRTFKDYSERIDEIRDLGGPVMIVMTQQGRGRDSAVPFVHQYAGICLVEDGLITSITMYTTPADALEAARASEQD